MNIAILMKNNFDFSQIAHNASANINGLIKNYPEHNIITCCLNNNKPFFKIKTANVPLPDLNHFDGLILTTCIDTTMYAKGMVRNNDILFYVWDLEWLRRGRKNYFENISAYRDVLLATRSNTYAVELMKYSGIMTKLITPNFNIQYLVDGYQQFKQANSRPVQSGR